MRLLRAVGCALLLAAAGCSGDGGDDFAAQANAVCADYDERIAAIETPADLDALAGSAEEIAGLIEQGTATLRELEPPADLADGFGEWLDLNDEAASECPRDLGRRRGRRPRTDRRARRPGRAERGGGRRARRGARARGMPRRGG